MPRLDGPPPRRRLFIFSFSFFVPTWWWSLHNLFSPFIRASSWLSLPPIFHAKEKKSLKDSPSIPFLFAV